MRLRIVVHAVHKITSETKGSQAWSGGSEEQAMIAPGMRRKDLAYCYGVGACVGNAVKCRPVVVPGA